MDCVEKHKDDMLTCLNKSVPSVFKDDVGADRKVYCIIKYIILFN